VKVGGIILSAGASRRMGTPKALLPIENETFLDRMIRLLAGVCNPVVVVLGNHAEQIRSGVQRASQVTFVVNPDPERGMLSSLQCALQALPKNVDAVMFTPVDHPGIQASTVERLAVKVRTTSAPVTIPTHRGAHGHPVCITRPVIAELLALPLSAQARDVIHAHLSEAELVAVDDPAVTTDIDDPAAYAELVAQRP
jgi:molybdenum cofactor cytidylyltransferase